MFYPVWDAKPVSRSMATSIGALSKRDNKGGHHRHSSILHVCSLPKEDDEFVRVHPEFSTLRHHITSQYLETLSGAWYVNFHTGLFNNSATLFIASLQRHMSSKSCTLDSIHMFLGSLLYRLYSPPYRNPSRHVGWERPPTVALLRS